MYFPYSCCYVFQKGDFLDPHHPGALLHLRSRANTVTSYDANWWGIRLETGWPTVRRFFNKKKRWGIPPSIASMYGRFWSDQTWDHVYRLVFFLIQDASFLGLPILCKSALSAASSLCFQQKTWISWKLRHPRAYSVKHGPPLFYKWWFFIVYWEMPFCRKFPSHVWLPEGKTWKNKSIPGNVLPPQASPTSFPHQEFPHPTIQRWCFLTGPRLELTSTTAGV